MEIIKYTSSSEQTIELGKQISVFLSTGFIIGLNGDLGAGKTCLVKGIFSGLSDDDFDNVTSPTFTIVNEYQTSIPIFHFDLYRIHGEDEFYSIGFDDYLKRDGICVIEWLGEAGEDFKPGLE